MRLVVLLCVVACGAACGREAPSATTERLRIAVEAAPSSLDPRFATDADSSRIAGLVHCALVEPDLAGGWSPALASSWSQPDAATWVFELKPGVRFHDGTAVSADDVVATYRSVLDPASGSSKRAALVSVTAVEADGPGRVRFRLTAANAAFLEGASIGILPAALAAQPRAAAATQVGCGPYRLESAAGQSVLLRAFDGWHGGPITLAAVEFRVVPDAVMRALQLRSGDLDLTQNSLEPDAVAHLATLARPARTANATTDRIADGSADRTAEGSGPGIAEDGVGRLAEPETALRVSVTPYDAYQYLGMNHRHPALADVRVRRAIAHAIDREAIVRHVLGGQAAIATGLLPSHHAGFEPRVRRYDYDPARARRLLDAAGFGDPDGDGPLPRLRLRYTTSTVELRRRIAEVLAAELAEVGIALSIESYEWGTFFEDIGRGDYDLYSLAWIGIRDPDLQRVVFHSAMTPPAGSNRGFFASARMDRLTERGRLEIDPARRRAVYARVQRLSARLLPYVPLWWPKNVVVMSSRLEGFRPHPAGDLAGLVHARLR